MRPGQHFLTTPYPPPYPDRRALVVGLLAGLFITAFLWYFRPFGMARGEFGARPVRIAGFGLITTAAFWLLDYAVPRWFPQWFRPLRWRVYHQLGYYLLLLALVTTGNGLYVNYVQELPFDWGNYLEMLGKTLAVGLPPVALVVLGRLAGRATDTAPAAPPPPPPPPPGPLVAEAYGNYVKLYSPPSPDANPTTPRLERTTLRDVVAEWG